MVTHRLLQVGDEDADHQRVCQGVIRAEAGRLGCGPDGLVDGLLSGGVGGGAAGVVGEAAGHLVLAGGGAAGHRQQLQGGRGETEELIERWTG